MSRYIDADKLTVYFEAFAKQAEMEGLYNMAHIHNRCLQIIKDAPTADVVEVRHSHWVVCGAFDDFLKCSSCGYNRPWQTAIEHKYCPNCGAKMDSERRTE